MALDAEFLRITSKYFNPYLPDSGTEHVAMLLYSMARMTRPEIIVEYGSGYSTMFVLRGLADNLNDYGLEKAALLEKTQELFNSSAISEQQALTQSEDLLKKWLLAEGMACQVNPEFYLSPYSPRLYSFEALPDSHEYVKKMSSAVKEIGHSNLFTHLTGQAPNVDSLALNGGFIDWAWNDDLHYREFFSAFWPLINPKGGLLIFHNAVSVSNWVNDIQWIIEQRSEAGDLEVLTLEEPHKLNQNGCVILRKKSEYTHSFHLENPLEVLDSMNKFMLSQ